MSDFSDISRMNLSELDRKGQQTQEGDEEITLSAEAEDEISESSVDETGEEMIEDETAENEIEPEVEVIDDKERMAAPNGKHYYVDAEITPKEMRAFMFAHNYRSPLMIMATLVGLVWPVYTAVKAEGSMMVACVCAAVFLILMPFSIWRRATTSVTQNAIYQNTFHYMLDETGIHLEIGSHTVNVEWSQVTKKMFLKSCVAVYTGKVNAYLIPTEAMGDRKEEITGFIKEHC